MSLFFESLDWAREPVRQLCLADPQFLPFFCDQSANGLHYVACALAHSHLPTDTSDIRSLAIRLRCGSRGEMLSHILGKQLPHGTVSVLGKLGAAVTPRERYCQLVSLLEEENARKTLWHVKEVDQSILTTLQALDPCFRRLGLVTALARNAAVDEFLYVLAGLRRALEPSAMLRVEESAVRINCPTAYQKWLSRWIERCPFPDPPWVGNNSIRPIRSVAALKDLARRFENCLADRAINVLLEHRTYYEIECPQAVVEVIHDPFFGTWRMTEVRGPGNVTISGVRLQALTTVFAAAGIQFLPERHGFLDRVRSLALFM